MRQFRLYLLQLISVIVFSSTIRFFDTYFGDCERNQVLLCSSWKIVRLPSGYWPTSEASGIVIFFRVPEGKRPWHVVVVERLVLKHQNFLSVPFFGTLRISNSSSSFLSCQRNRFWAGLQRSLELCFSGFHIQVYFL